MGQIQKNEQYRSTKWVPALEATQGQMDGFFSQLPYKCYLEEVASVGNGLKICPQLDSRVDPWCVQTLIIKP